MDKLKTDLKELKRDGLSINVSTMYSPLPVTLTTESLLHDSILAHTFQARIKEVLAIKLEEIYHGSSADMILARKLARHLLKEIKAKLRGG